MAAAGGAVLEVNTTPGLQYHYQTTSRRGAGDDGARPVAETVLEHLLAVVVPRPRSQVQ